MTPEQGMQIRLKAGFLMNMQTDTGVSFNKQTGELAFRVINKGMRNIERIIRPKLPRVHISVSDYKKRLPPATKLKNMKKCPVGMTHSNHLVNWCTRFGHQAYSLIGKQKGEPVVTIEGIEFILTLNQLDDWKPSDTTDFDLWSNAHMLQLKNHLIECYGWRPTLWNYKKGKDGKPIYDRDTREKVKVSPKFQHQGDMCPNLEALGTELRFVNGIVKWVQLKHRRGILRKKDGTGGWLGNDRVIKDGRISATASAITNTMRQKHTVVCNVPRPSSFMGGLLRACIQAPSGMVAVGYDASSLEDVVKAHYAFRYDGGEYAQKIQNPAYDAHTEMAERCGITRQDAKPVNYGSQYGQQAKGLAEVLGCSVERAQEILDGYWEVNWGYAALLKALEKHWEVMDKKGIVCPVSGLFLHSRSKNSLGSLLIQHTGAFIMDLAGNIMDKWLGGIICDERPHYMYKGYKAERAVYYHDELMWCCEPEIAEEILELGKESIREAGRVLKLNVPLDADGAIGANWRDIH